MAIKSVYLTMPTPCQQRWQDMEDDGTGRYCANCRKTVVDFSTLTDEQIGSLLAQPNSSNCGRFRLSQLNRALPVPATQPHSPVQLFSLLTVGLLGYQTVQATTNTVPMLSNPPTQQITKSPITSSVSSVIEETPSVDSLLVITGRVVEQTKNVGIQGVAVHIKGTMIGTNTDAEGRFQINIPAELVDELISLRVSNIGYLVQEVQLRPSQSAPTLVRLREDEAALNQVVVMGYYMRDYKRPTFFQRLRNRLRPNH